MHNAGEELLASLRALNLCAMAAAVEDTALRAAKEGLSRLVISRPRQQSDR
jgi:hypothetical protein